MNITVLKSGLERLQASTLPVPLPPLDAMLGDFADIQAPWPLYTLVSKRREEIEVASNWKAILEVFNEYYHLPFVHPDSIDDVYDPPL